MKNTRDNPSRAALRAALPHTIPILAGFLFLGITYGVLVTTSGFPFYLPIIMAVVIFTGSMEFLMTSILLSAFHPVAVFATALMVCARHIFYGITMLPRYRGLGWKKYYLIYSCCDETFSINYSTEIPEEIDHGWFYFWVSFLDQIYWVGGAALGGIFGSFITLDTRGLDFVMTAMFVVIFLQQWEKDRSHAAEFIGLGASILCLLVFGPDRFIVPSMLVILLCLTIGRKKLEPVYSANAGNAQPADEESAFEQVPTYTGTAGNAQSADEKSAFEQVPKIGGSRRVDGNVSGEEPQNE